MSLLEMRGVLKTKNERKTMRQSKVSVWVFKFKRCGKVVNVKRLIALKNTANVTILGLIVVCFADVRIA